MQSVGAKVRVGGDRKVTLQLPEEVSQGEYEVMLVLNRVHKTRTGEPLQNQSTQSDLKKLRTFGQFQGQIQICDDFDAPLPDEFWLGEA